jgi:hypothetical protein
MVMTGDLPQPLDVIQHLARRRAVPVSVGSSAKASICTSGTVSMLDISLTSRICAGFRRGQQNPAAPG